MRGGSELDPPRIITPLTEPFQQQLVQSARRIHWHPMAGVRYFLVSPRPVYQRTRLLHPLAVQEMVSGRPYAHDRGGYRRQLPPWCRQPGGEVGPVPVQRRGERSWTGQVCYPLLLVPVAAGERPQPGPVVVLDGRFGDAGE